MDILVGYGKQGEFFCLFCFSKWSMNTVNSFKQQAEWHLIWVKNEWLGAGKVRQEWKQINYTAQFPMCSDFRT